MTFLSVEEQWNHMISDTSYLLWAQQDHRQISKIKMIPWWVTWSPTHPSWGGSSVWGMCGNWLLQRWCDEGGFWSTWRWLKSLRCEMFRTSFVFQGFNISTANRCTLNISECWGWRGARSSLLSCVSSEVASLIWAAEELGVSFSLLFHCDLNGVLIFIFIY